MKSEIFNLIILDESGSMSCVKNATISGCNETLNTIRSAQEKYADTQEHFVSIYVFQENAKVPSRYLIKNAPIANVSNINAEQYEPWGGTPLFDAIGSTLADLKAIAKDKQMAVGNVTIITDGMENASRYYSLEKVSKMIEALKEIGWSFNFIGANIDVKGTAASLNIDNALEFNQDECGTQAMFERERKSRTRWFGRVSALVGSRVGAKSLHSLIDDEELQSMRSELRNAAEDYFDEDSPCVL